MRRVPWAFVISVAVIAVMGISRFERNRERKREQTCCVNVKLLALGLLQYAADHDNRLPPARTWQRAAFSYPKTTQQNLVCPSDRQHTMPGYGYSPAWADQDLYQIPQPSEAVMLFDAVKEQPAYRHLGGPYWCSGDSGRRGLVLGYCDGHVHASGMHAFTPERARMGRDSHYHPAGGTTP